MFGHRRITALQNEGRCFSRYGDAVINGFYSDFESKKTLSIGELFLTATNFVFTVWDLKLSVSKHGSLFYPRWYSWGPT